MGIAGCRSVPGDIDVALRIRGHRASAVETVGVSDNIAFAFEGGAGVVEARIEKRLFASGGAFAHAIPGDVNAAILSNGELSAANGAQGHGGMWLGINRQGFGKFALPGLAAD